MLKTLIIATVLLPMLAFAQQSQQLPQPRQPGQWCPVGWVLLMRAHPNCNLDHLVEVSFEFDHAGRIINCTGISNQSHNINHDYAGSGLARLYRAARRRLDTGLPSAPILQFPNRAIK